jgi:hypothetical protein
MDAIVATIVGGLLTIAGGLVGARTADRRAESRWRRREESHEIRKGRYWLSPITASQPATPGSGHRVDRASLVGYTWHHIRHARACIDRGRSWQAEHWISGIRDNVLTLASAAGQGSRLRQGRTHLA